MRYGSGISDKENRMMKTDQGKSKEECIIQFLHDLELVETECWRETERRLDHLLAGIQGIHDDKDRAWMAEVDRVEKLITQMLPIRKSYWIERKENAFEFNVFGIIGQSSAKSMGFYDSEIHVHSPFLGELLNPKGTHGQGMFFFNTFLDFLADETQKHPIPPDKLERFRGVDEAHIIFTRERHHVDILIRSTHPEHRFAMILENKIRAMDQKEQLERYYDEIRRIYKYSDEELLLLYLTVDGSYPAAYSLSPLTRKRLEDTGVFYRIGYKKMIVSWLDFLLDNERFRSGLSNLRVVIGQYRAILDQL